MYLFFFPHVKGAVFLDKNKRSIMIQLLKHWSQLDFQKSFAAIWTSLGSENVAENKGNHWDVLCWFEDVTVIFTVSKICPQVDL